MGRKKGGTTIVFYIKRGGENEGQPHVYDIMKGEEKRGTTELPVSDIDIPSSFMHNHIVNIPCISKYKRCC